MLGGKNTSLRFDEYIPLQVGYAMAESVLFWSSGEDSETNRDDGALHGSTSTCRG